MSKSRLTLGQWQSGLSEDQLSCRDFRHAWKATTAKRIKGGFERQLHCERCGAFKEQQLDLKGFVIKTKFIYGENYVRPAGSGRVTRDENASLRVQLMRRLVK